MLPRSSTGPADAAAVVVLVTQARELVWQCCLLARERSPGALEHVPAEDDLAAAHRALSRTAVACAQTAQALVLAPGPEAPLRAATAAVTRAEEALAALSGRC